ISNLVPELVIDLLKVVDVDQIEDKITIVKVGGWIADKRAQHLLHIGLNRIGEEPPVPNAGEQVGQRSVKQLMIGVGQFLFEAGLFHNADKSEDHNGGQRQHNAEFPNRVWQTSVEERPRRQKRQDEGNRGGESRSPPPVSFGV